MYFFYRNESKNCLTKAYCITWWAVTTFNDIQTNPVRLEAEPNKAWEKPKEDDNKAKAVKA